MNIKEYAQLLNGREYNYPQFTKEEIEMAKENGFVIIYGVSDDLMEFEGSIQDEGGCFDGGNVYFNKTGVIVMDDNFATSFEQCIKAIWCGGGKDEEGREITWTYETDIPHETFMIYDDGEPYCKGIVFDIKDVK